MSDKLQLGVIIDLGKGPKEEIKKVHDLGLPTCQVQCWDPIFYTEQNLHRLKAAAEKYEVQITTIWSGYPGPSAWNFTEGPSTIGFVPPEYRRIRVDALKKGADFAAGCGVKSVTTHAGFIPENPADALYKGTIDALREIAEYCVDLGLNFCFETGQETPITLLRAITDIGTKNLGVNIDPANLLMYGKANPVDALDIFGKHIQGVHAKDGVYPSNPNELGGEKPLGEGLVNFPVFVPKLKKLGYTGALTIEREIAGPEQIADIKMAMELLEPYL
jgi:sugar phosphate isomerase/epimerase